MVSLPASFVVLGAIALALVDAYLLAGIFGLMPHYRICDAEVLPPNDSP